ncbi:hypothetical protein Cob_v007920 [Colletotrichum orbiculare MAFF 240422]|uniref:Uncharacterized protein n=1 Tax=Colletotrichum orbiculare (strain 104-T / ATCC 96160 / CBS 514.97 / LARS 414 / MAFF 240422) TaxID=1213857 RepID=N4VVN2_COLOR|nr:hypothetical protein Cob_v007920 [Colletotrichum orbiculare MAFF 240422]
MQTPVVIADDKSQYVQEILSTWSLDDLGEIVGAEFSPNNWSVGLLANLRHLCRSKVALEDARRRLRAQIDRRAQGRSSVRGPHRSFLAKVDAEKVIEEGIKTTSGTLCSKMNERPGQTDGASKSKTNATLPTTVSIRNPFTTPSRDRTQRGQTSEEDACSPKSGGPVTTHTEREEREEPREKSISPAAGGMHITPSATPTLSSHGGLGLLPSSVKESQTSSSNLEKLKRKRTDLLDALTEELERERKRLRLEVVVAQSTVNVHRFEHDVAQGRLRQATVALESLPPTSESLSQLQQHKSLRNDFLALHAKYANVFGSSCGGISMSLGAAAVPCNGLTETLDRNLSGAFGVMNDCIFQQVMAIEREAQNLEEKRAFLAEDVEKMKETAKRWEDALRAAEKTYSNLLGQSLELAKEKVGN